MPPSTSRRSSSVAGGHTPGSRRYIISDTGQPGGKRTGQKCSHYIAKGGPFAIACAELLKTGLQVALGVRAQATSGREEWPAHQVRMR